MAALILALHQWLQQLQGTQTNIDRHRCKREVPMKVLNLGYSRTGTTSIREALHELGIHDVYHADAFYKFNPPDADMWVEAFEGKFGSGTRFTRKDWDKLLGHCMAVSDAPIVPHFVDDIIEAYPEAKVVISLRDSPEQWWKSYRDTLIPFAIALLPNDSLRSRIYRAFLPRLSFDEYHKWIMKRTGSLDDVYKFGPAIYAEHNQHVRDVLVAKRGEKALDTDLLEFNVKQGYQPLCEFLGVSVPTDAHGNKKSFPYANDTANFKKIANDLENLMNLLVGVNVVCSIGAVVAVAYAARWYLASA